MKRFSIVVSLFVAMAFASCSSGGGDNDGTMKMSAFRAVSQNGTAGLVVPQLPAVKIVDGSGVGVGGVPVNFAIGVGGGTLSGGAVTTGTDGVASVTSWVLGKLVGTNTLIASSSELGAARVTFTATGKAGAPAKVTRDGGISQAVLVGTQVAVKPSAWVTDVNNNGIPGVTVTFAVALGGGSVTGTSAITNNSGIATVGSWTVGLASGVNTLTAAVGGITSLPFTAIGLPGPAVELGIATQPNGALNGTAFAIQPVVQARDANHNLVTTVTPTVTAALESGPNTLSGTTTATAVGGVATFTNLTFNGTGSGAIRFSAPGLGSVLSNVLPVVPFVPVNLTIDGMHITQSTQTYTGTVPLITGRAALIRVFAKATQANSLQPAVRVRLYQGANLVQTYTIPSAGVSVPTSIVEANLNASWNVSIPSNILQPGMTILADIDPSSSMIELTRDDNSFPVHGTPLVLDVRTTPTFLVSLVPIVQTPNGLQGDVTEANKSTYLDFATRVYPLAAIDAQVHSPYNYAAALAGTSYDASWTNLLAEMRALRLAEGGFRYYYGVIKPGYSSGGTGYGNIAIGAAIGVDWLGTVNPNTNYRSMTAAHEWGHNFGRSHIDCGEPSNPDMGYPYNPATIGTVGYDLAINATRASTLADLMSYCKPLWISDYTYRAVMNYRATGSLMALTAAPQRSLLVWGRIGPQGIVLEPAFEIVAVPSIPSEGGPYRVSGTDANGATLFDFSFDADAVDHSPGEKNFAFVVPLPEGSSAAGVQLVSGSVALTRRSANLGANAAAAVNALNAATLRTAQSNVATLEWDETIFPAALVRDPATGQVLAIARGGRATIVGGNRDLEITFSDGATSSRRLVRVRP